MKRLYIWAILILSVLALTIGVFISDKSSNQEQITPVYGYGLPHPENIKNPAKPGNAYIITIDRLTIQDLANNSNLFHNMLQNGSLALMSSSVEGSMNPDSTFASIGAGAPINAHGTSDRGFNAQEFIHGFTAEEVYRQRTGVAASDNNVLQLDIARIKYLNKDNRYSSVPGYLGSLLQENGFRVEVLGNSDIPNTPRRPAVALAMNQDGLVNRGDVSFSVLMEDKDFPGGYRSNYTKILDLALSTNKEPGLTVIELGDLDRLERMGEYLESRILQLQRQETISRIADFITDMQKSMRTGDILIVVSPTPKGNFLPGFNYLTPVIAFSEGIDSGILTSPTTRRPGIIKNTDLAPTILNHYGIIVPQLMFGRALQVIPTDNTIAKLMSLNKEVELTYQTRSPILRNYVLIQLILVGLSLIAILVPKRNTLMLVLKPLLLGVMAVPVALLVLPLLPHTTATTQIAELIAITVGIIAAIHLWLNDRRNELDPFILISMLTSLCIVIDLFLGAPLQKTSLLSYHPIVGARYYGLGNEYMGILIGSTIIGTTALLTRFSEKRKYLLTPIGIYYLITLYVIAAPQLGTNVGGSISGAGSFLITFLLLAGVKFNLKTILKAAATVLFFLASILLYDLQRPLENQSHIGRTVELILKGGPGEILNIITRKISMNIKLIRYTIWSRIFLASLASLAILFFRPVGIMQKVSSQYSDMHKGFIGVVIASVIALVFNDSGIVAAATTMIFGAPPLLYLVIRALRLGY